MCGMFKEVLPMKQTTSNRVEVYQRPEPGRRKQQWGDRLAVFQLEKVGPR